LGGRLQTHVIDIPSHRTDKFGQAGKPPSLRIGGEFWRQRVVFIPLSDDNPLESIQFQFVTVALIAINVAVFAVTFAGVDPYVVSSFAVRPSELFLVNVHQA
jgi:hypothetical protein